MITTLPDNVIAGGNMFNKRRSEIQIIGEILNISQTGARKTEILYKSNMSFTQLNSYLNFLINKNVLKEDMVPDENGSSIKIYKNTDRGNQLLGDINKILNYFE
jgi:predicted transcriptional regulator